MERFGKLVVGILGSLILGVITLIGCFLAGGVLMLFSTGTSYQNVVAMLVMGIPIITTVVSLILSIVGVCKHKPISRSNNTPITYYSWRPKRFSFPPTPTGDYFKAPSDTSVTYSSRCTRRNSDKCTYCIRRMEHKDEDYFHGDYSVSYYYTSSLECDAQ